MKSVLNDILTGSYKTAYLFYGMESYLISQYRDKLRAAFANEFDASNVNIFSSKNIDYKEVCILADTPPFFSDKRLIIINDETQFTKKANETLIKYLESPAPFTHFLFIAGEINKTFKLYKHINSKGRVVEFARQDGRTLCIWIEKLAMSENKRIEKSAIDYIITMCDSDMQKIRLELEKLFSYKLKEENIGLADAKSLIAYRPENNVFSMMDAIAVGDKLKALKHYSDLLALNEPHMRILFLLNRHFLILARVAEFQKKGYNKEQIAKESKIPPFAVAKYILQAKALGTKAIYETLEMCAQADESIKTGIKDEKSAIEPILLRNFR